MDLKMHFSLPVSCSTNRTNYHLGTLKAKLARLRNELFVEQSGGGGGGPSEGFDVARNGDARVALIGFPSVGKSTLLSKLTETESLVASYEFTTLVRCLMLDAVAMLLPLFLLCCDDVIILILVFDELLNVPVMCM